MHRLPVVAQAVLVLAGIGAEAALEVLATAVEVLLVILQEVGVGAGVVAEVALVLLFLEADIQSYSLWTQFRAMAS